LVTADNLAVVEAADSVAVAYRVGDRVALADDLSRRDRALQAGTVGTIVCDGLPWNMVSVQFTVRGHERVFQLHPRHLRPVQNTAAAPPDRGGDQALGGAVVLAPEGAAGSV
jgi:hypothetical protein